MYIVNVIIVSQSMGRVTTFHGTGRTGPVDICADAFRKPFLEGIPPKRREENAKMSRPFLKGTTSDIAT
jgi:hypothetical protein